MLHGVRKAFLHDPIECMFDRGWQPFQFCDVETDFKSRSLADPFDQFAKCRHQSAAFETVRLQVGEQLSRFGNGLLNECSRLSQRLGDVPDQRLDLADRTFQEHQCRGDFLDDPIVDFKTQELLFAKQQRNQPPLLGSLIERTAQRAFGRLILRPIVAISRHRRYPLQVSIDEILEHLLPTALVRADIALLEHVGFERLEIGFA